MSAVRRFRDKSYNKRNYWTWVKPRPHVPLLKTLEFPPWAQRSVTALWHARAARPHLWNSCLLRPHFLSKRSQQSLFHGSASDDVYHVNGGCHPPPPFGWAAFLWRLPFFLRDAGPLGPAVFISVCSSFLFLAWSPHHPIIFCHVRNIEQLSSCCSMPTVTQQ